MTLLTTWLLFFSGTVAAAVPSARRAPDASFHEYLEAARRSMNDGRVRSHGLPSEAVIDRADPFTGGAALAPAPEWEDLDALNRRFAVMRDARVLSARGRPDFARRITWLYPEDGCYARAAVGVTTLTRLEPDAPVPGKIFAFGNLSVRSAFAHGGRAWWWYHVAPVVRVDGVNWVLDPSIEPARPLSADEWIERQSTKPEAVRVAVCGGATYSPTSRCVADATAPAVMALKDEAGFLDLEWQRIVELSRDPAADLGDRPPWR